MKNLTLIILLFFTYNLSAQTKLIYHKSHSGSVETFKLALENNSLDLDKANFGLPSDRRVERLDSVIYLSDSTVKLVKSIWLMSYDLNQKEIKAFTKKEKPKYYDFTYNYAEVGYNKQNIRKWLKRYKYMSGNYYLMFKQENKFDKIKFIGFENDEYIDKKEEKTIEIKKEIPDIEKESELKEDIKKEEFVPLDYYQNQPPSFPNILIYTLFGSVLFLALMAGFLMYQLKLKLLK